MVTKSESTKRGLVRAAVRRFRARFRRTPLSVAVPSGTELSLSQRRRLLIVVAVAALAGAILVWSYIPIIILAALAAVIFNPIYSRIVRRLHRTGTSASLTFVIMLLVFIIPLAITVLLTIGQVEQLVSKLEASGTTPQTFTELSNVLLTYINQLLGTLTRGAVQIDIAQLNETLAHLAAELGNKLLGLLTSSFAAIATVVTEFILFLYLFTSLLTHGQDMLASFRNLNPLGEKVASLYISRTGQMARGAVGGQFIIAAAQGFVEAGILYLAGIDYFFLMALILTFLSIIPLGGGVVAIPIGIAMLLTGNVWQGIVILLGHFVIITNIDNVLRPRLVPKAVRMNPALMLLSVFGGLALFGFLGIFVGPIIMILVLSTFQVYLPLAKQEAAISQTQVR